MESMAKSLICVVFESTSLPGIWVSHDLTHDIVTQGNSRIEALKALVEAIQMCDEDDLDKGHNLDERSSAPLEFWENIKYETF